eukprot:m.328125 g.328125  ORF g.328125 m.328125 type:complete len:383 (+) comp20425_c0_seq7:414-1562(+)
MNFLFRNVQLLTCLSNSCLLLAMLCDFLFPCVILSAPNVKRPRRESFSVILNGMGDTEDAIGHVNSYLDSFPDMAAILKTGSDFDGTLDDSLQLDSMGPPGDGSQTDALDSQMFIPPQDAALADFDSPNFRFGADSLSNTMGAFGGAQQVPHSQHSSSYLQHTPYGSQHSDPHAYGSAAVNRGTSVSVSQVATTHNSQMAHGAFNSVSTLAHAAPDWKTAFQHDNERLLCVERLQLILNEYTTEPGPLARQIENSAFDEAQDKERYFQLLAIQTYKLRKLARGEMMPPVLLTPIFPSRVALVFSPRNDAGETPLSRTHSHIMSIVTLTRALLRCAPTSCRLSHRPVHSYFVVTPTRALVVHMSDVSVPCVTLWRCSDQSCRA